MKQNYLTAVNLDMSVLLAHQIFARIDALQSFNNFWQGGKFKVLISLAFAANINM